jgi:hypothetical protein
MDCVQGSQGSRIEIAGSVQQRVIHPDETESRKVPLCWGAQPREASPLDRTHKLHSQEA